MTSKRIPGDQVRWFNEIEGYYEDGEIGGDTSFKCNKCMKSAGFMEPDGNGPYVYEMLQLSPCIDERENWDDIHLCKECYEKFKQWLEVHD